MQPDSLSPPLYTFQKVLCVLLLCARCEAMIWQPSLPSFPVPTPEEIRGYENLSIAGMLIIVVIVLLWTVRHLWTRDITLSDQQRERLVQRIADIEALLEKALTIGDSTKELLRSAEEQSAGLRQREREFSELKVILSELKNLMLQFHEQMRLFIPRGKQ